MTASHCLVLLSLLSIAAAATAAVAGASAVAGAVVGAGAGACRASAGTLKLLKASRRPREIPQAVPSVARNASGLLARQDDVSTAGHLKNETGLEKRASYETSTGVRGVSRGRVAKVEAERNQRTGSSSNSNGRAIRPMSVESDKEKRGRKKGQEKRGRKKGQVGLRWGRRCEYPPGCDAKAKHVIYGEIDSRPSLCKDHREKTSINLSPSVLRCGASGCLKMGVYGMPLKEGGVELGLMPENGGQGIKGRRGIGKLKGTVLHCKDHKLHGEIDSRNKRCIVAGCGKRASFGTRAPEGQSKKGEGPMFCKSHSREGDVNLHMRVCKSSGCKRQPVFGRVEDGKAVACLAHKDEEMVDICNRRCEAVLRGWNIERAEPGQFMCTNRASFSASHGSKATFCSLHRPYTSPNVVTKSCEHPGCSLAPSFPRRSRASGMGGHRNRRWCKQHSSGRDSEQLEREGRDSGQLEREGRDSEQLERGAGKSRQCGHETVASQHAEKKESDS